MRLVTVTGLFQVSSNKELACMPPVCQVEIPQKPTGYLDICVKSPERCLDCILPKDISQEENCLGKF